MYIIQTYTHTKTDPEAWQPVTGSFVKCFHRPLSSNPVLTIRNPKATVKILPRCSLPTPPHQDLASSELDYFSFKTPWEDAQESACPPEGIFMLCSDVLPRMLSWTSPRDPAVYPALPVCFLCSDSICNNAHFC